MEDQPTQWERAREVYVMPQCGFVIHSAGGEGWVSGREQKMLLIFLSLMGTDRRSGEDSLGLWLLMSKVPVLEYSSA